MLPRYNSGSVSPEPLARSLKLYPSGRIVKNRLMKGPMTEGLATWDPQNHPNRGIPTEKHVELYKRWGEGENNWGIIVTGNISIEFDTVGQIGNTIITPECPMTGHRFEMFSKIAVAAKKNGSVVIGQVVHPGRQVLASINPEPISASNVQLLGSGPMVFGKPRPATEEDIGRVIQGYVHAALYLEKAGFDGIELHAAHGYLISQFLSRTTNLRTDKYGVQSTENRLRFIKEICSAIKGKVSHNFIVGAKLNSVEFENGGITVQEAYEVCVCLQEMGLDYVQLSGGTFENLGLSWEKESTRRREAYFLEWVERVMQAFDSPDRKLAVFLSGGLRSVGNMVRALDVADGVSLARPAILEPLLAHDILAGRVLGAIQPVPELEASDPKVLFVAQTQIKQISEGKDPFDSSDKEAVEHFNMDMGMWFQKKAADGGNHEVSEVIDYTGPTNPYGTRRQQHIEPGGSHNGAM